MDYQCDIQSHPQVLLAVAGCVTPRNEIPTRIPALFELVYGWLEQADCKRSGNNTILYDQFRPDGMRMRVGFPVSDRFADTEQICCVNIDARKAAHARHVGAYKGLPDAHQAVNDWCEAQQLQRFPLAWEVYGDWSDDESKLVTDVYVALSSS